MAAQRGHREQRADPAPRSWDSDNLSFSRDGNYVYYVFNTGTSPPTLYTMPVLGGNTRKLASFPDIAYASLSPDEKRLAFIRTKGRAGPSQEKALIIRQYRRQQREATGSAEVAGVGGRGPGMEPGRQDHRVRRHTRNPIARSMSYASLMAVPSEGGPEKRMGSRTWLTIGPLRWLPNGHGTRCQRLRAIRSSIRFGTSPILMARREESRMT